MCCFNLIRKYKLCLKPSSLITCKWNIAKVKRNDVFERACNIHDSQKLKVVGMKQAVSVQTVKTVVNNL